MPRPRSRVQPALSDAIAFHLVTHRYAPKGRFATTWDALLLAEDAKPALRQMHREELRQWERDHPECWQEAKALEAAADDAQEDDEGGRRA